MTSLPRTPLRVSILVVVALLAATPSLARSESQYPNVTVTDIARSKPFNLSELAILHRPVLLWFWAPH